MGTADLIIGAADEPYVIGTAEPMGIAEPICMGIAEPCVIIGTAASD